MREKLFAVVLCLILVSSIFSSAADAAVIDVIRLKTPFVKHTIYDNDGNYIQINFDAKNNTVEIKEADNSRVFVINTEDENEVQDEKQEQYQIDPKISYSDMENHWAKDDILLLASMGLLKGYPDGTFKPNNIITRAEFATLLTRVLELEQGQITPVSTSNFQDVNENHWFFDYVAKLEANKNLNVKYYANTRLNPNEPITRQEIALWISSELPTTKEKTNFADQNTIKYVEEVNQAVSAGILKGYPDGNFKPSQSATRAEAAALVIRVLHFKEVL